MQCVSKTGRRDILGERTQRAVLKRHLKSCVVVHKLGWLAALISIFSASLAKSKKLSCKRLTSLVPRPLLEISSRGFVNFVYEARLGLPRSEYFIPREGRSCGGRADVSALLLYCRGLAAEAV